MKPAVLATLAMLTLGNGLALAQATQPYLGMQERPIKALSDQRGYAGSGHEDRHRLHR